RSSSRKAPALSCCKRNSFTSRRLAQCSGNCACSSNACYDLRSQHNSPLLQRLVRLLLRVRRIRQTFDVYAQSEVSASTYALDMAVAAADRPVSTLFASLLL